jgi:hypothetical protein
MECCGRDERAGTVKDLEVGQVRKGLIHGVIRVV